MTKYRIPIVVELELEAVDYRDAADIGERAVKSSIMEYSSDIIDSKPVLLFTTADGREWATRALSVQELNRSMVNQTGPLFLYRVDNGS